MGLFKFRVSVMNCSFPGLLNVTLNNFSYTLPLFCYLIVTKFLPRRCKVLNVLPKCFFAIFRISYLILKEIPLLNDYYKKIFSLSYLAFSEMFILIVKNPLLKKTESFNLLKNTIVILLVKIWGPPDFIKILANLGKVKAKKWPKGSVEWIVG